MTDFLPELIGLFSASFFAATLLPGGSELVLLALVATHPQESVAIVVVATLGNTFGGLSNWWLGRYLLRYQEHRWFPVSPGALARVQGIFAKYGQWSLLLSWLPVIGDALCLAAGVAKLSLWKAAIWVLVGKATRYVALVYGTNAILLS